MKKTLLLFITVLLLFTACKKNNSKIEANTLAANTQKSKVYFSEDVSAESIVKLYEYINDDVTGKIGFKLHFGEKGNTNFLSPSLIEPLVTQINATLIETNVLYVSPRRYTESHIALAKEHGFTFAPIDILDSEGDTTYQIKKQKHFDGVRVGTHMKDYETIVVYSHFKGHGMAGFGGAIKNVAMGLGAVSGKMAMHASKIPDYKPEKCISCGICVSQCPAGAISIDPLIIDPEKCIGCGACIGVCPQRAFSVPWRSTDRNVFMERLVEYAKGISDNKKMVYINVLANISDKCDCAGSPGVKPFMKDVGVLVSTDMLAIEQASLDLVNKAYGASDAFLSESHVSGDYQLEYAEKIGLGNRHYELIDIDKK